MRKARAIEDAIVGYLDAFDQLPASAVIPTRIVLTKKSGEEFLRPLRPSRTRRMRSSDSCVRDSDCPVAAAGGRPLRVLMR